MDLEAFPTLKIHRTNNASPVYTRSDVPVVYDFDAEEELDENDIADGDCEPDPEFVKSDRKAIVEKQPEPQEKASSLDTKSRILNYVKKCFAEFFATGFLVFYITTSPTANALSGAFNLAFSIWLAGPVSGGHINPGVTFLMLIQQKIEVALGFLYIISQILGSIIGALIGKAIVDRDPVRILGTIDTTVLQSTLGMTVVFSDASNSKNATLALIVESCAAFYFFCVVLSVTDAPRFKSEPLGGGIAPALASMFIGLATIPSTAICAKISSGSLNPARTLGPAVANNNFQDQWIFILAPFLGAFVALIVYTFIWDTNLSQVRIRDYFICCQDSSKQTNEEKS